MGTVYNILDIHESLYVIVFIIVIICIYIMC